jgi:hypothetical protein
MADTRGAVRRQVILLAWVGPLVLLALGIVLIPAVLAQGSSDAAVHLTQVPDTTLAAAGLRLEPPLPNPPGCEGLVKMTSEAGHGRAASENLCPNGYGPKPALAGNGAVLETVKADCSLARPAIRHRACWVVVSHGGATMVKPDFYYYDPALTKAAPSGYVRSLVLTFVDAHTGSRLATVQVVYRA